MLDFCIYFAIFVFLCKGQTGKEMALYYKGNSLFKNPPKLLRKRSKTFITNVCILFLMRFCVEQAAKNTLKAESVLQDDSIAGLAKEIRDLEVHDPVKVLRFFLTRKTTTLRFLQICMVLHHFCTIFVLRPVELPNYQNYSPSPAMGSLVQPADHSTSPWPRAKVSKTIFKNISFSASRGRSTANPQGTI